MTGSALDVRMRPARRKDYAVIWEATLQTVWDDVPEDERTRLDRRKWESHFCKKIEPYIEGDGTARRSAENPERELVGYPIVGATAFLTPATPGFIYDMWCVPDPRGDGG